MLEFIYRQYHLVFMTENDSRTSHFIGIIRTIEYKQAVGGLSGSLAGFTSCTCFPSFARNICEYVSVYADMSKVYIYLHMDQYNRKNK